MGGAVGVDSFDRYAMMSWVELGKVLISEESGDADDAV